MRWGTVVGALPRILQCREVLGETGTYFERLRIANEALGPHWVFRLADAVGLDQIKLNRPSWHRFYVEDIDRLHCPLDPGAPETEDYLGRAYSDMDMAFYAGMGFDGYTLALRTPRLVSIPDKRIDFDSRYRLDPSMDAKIRLSGYESTRVIPKEAYYASYAEALRTLYGNIEGLVENGRVNPSCDEEQLERTIAGCLIVMCGAHQGCLSHPNPAEKFHAQMESLIIFNHATAVMVGETPLVEASSDDESEEVVA